ncbi:MAG TPA: ATP-dependent 6-phosphofructokinase [Candidatus Limnocylindrales bacterium]|jgi:ATP-dependent phosphofructokinase / diphosphate-dependent phosphofructokinase|nr:ATP-dependent 6-phosphofructokinase [Candidatus Limnocylindrales bacterium]
MSSAIRTIGVCNGGGDCPGLNAVIRAVVRTAKLDYGWRVIGVTNGFNGLIWPEQSDELTLESIRGILPRGGTILGTTNRGNPFKFPMEENGKTVIQDCSHRCLEGMKKLGIEAMVVIGGDGTLSIAHDFTKIGMKVVGVPKTIDNDLQATEVTFGFDTALHVATDAIDRLHTTAESHQRVMVVEVMGRTAGWIALHSGIAGGADVILIPEIPFTIETVCESIRRREDLGRSFCIVVVAEGVHLPAEDGMGKPFPKPQPGQVGNSIGFAIREYLKKEVRVTVLGHVQRGGSPSPFDRTLATRFGVCAVDLVARGEFGRMVCLHAGRIDSVPISEAIGALKLVDPSSDYVRAARAVGITFGDKP